MSIRVLQTLCWSLLGAVMVGCGGGQLQGRVVAGPSPSMVLVSADDPRLKPQPGEPNLAAQLQIVLDPHRLDAVHKPPYSTQADGVFAVSIAEAAGGLQTYRVSLTATASGYHPATDAFDWPDRHQRLLITLPPAGHSASELPMPRGNASPNLNGVGDLGLEAEPSLDDLMQQARDLEAELAPTR